MKKKSSKIAIIGAGLTGLTSAYKLTQLGYSVDIYESSNDIGGLAGGFSFHGASLEKAYHHIFLTDTKAMNLIDELKMTDELRWFDSSVAMIHKNETGNFTLSPFNGAVDLIKYNHLSFFSRIRAGLITLFLQHYSKWEKLTSITAAKWMNKWGGVEVFEKLWSPLLSGKFNLFANKISMAWLWARIHVRANSRPHILAKEQLGYLRYGFASISQKLIEEITRLQNAPVNEFLFLNTKVKEIKGTTVIFKGTSKKYDTVIGTIPTEPFYELINRSTNKEKIQYLNAITLAFSSDQSLSQYYWHNIMSKDAPFLVFIQHTNLVPQNWYEEKNIYYIGAYIPDNHEYMNTSNNDLEEIWFSYLKKIFPNFDESKIEGRSLFKFKYAQHVVDTDYASKIPPFCVEKGKVYLSNFSQIFPEDRGVNYAISAGEKIAKQVHQDLLQ